MNQFLELDTEKRSDIKIIEQDSAVTDAIALLRECSYSQYRQHALQNIEEDKNLYQGLTDGLANPDVFAQLKDTSLMQVVRIVSEDNHSLPEAMPLSSKEIDESILYAIGAIKKKYEIEGALSDKMRDIIEHACYMEGTSFLRILPESYKDLRLNKELSRLSFARVDAAKTFYDPRCVRDISEGSWVGFMERYNNVEARKIARDLYNFEEEVTYGDALNVFIPAEGTGDDEDTVIATPNETTFYTFYNKVTKTYLVFAGQDGQLLIKKEGDKYPCKDKYGQADIPVVQYNATPYRKGIHCSSYIGVAKDIVVNRTKQWNTMLPHFERVNSPILAVMGAISPQQLADDLSDAIEAQAVGQSGILPLADPQARVETIFPQDISAAFERIMAMFDNELAKRLGLNLSAQEKQVSGSNPTATQVIEQSKIHAKAIANLNKINTLFYKRTYDIIVNYGRVLLKGSEEEFSIAIADIPVKATGNDLVELIKEWRGSWIIDTSVELQLDRNEKIAVITEQIGELTGMIQLTIMSEDEIKPIRDLTWAKITSLKLNDFIQRAEFDAFFTAIATRNQKQQEIDIAMQNQSTTGGQGAPAPTGEGESMPETQRQAARLGATAIEQPGTAGV